MNTKTIAYISQADPFTDRRACKPPIQRKVA